jgi:hypothetical protein
MGIDSKSVKKILDECGNQIIQGFSDGIKNVNIKKI